MAQQAGWLSPSTGEMPKGQRGSVIINMYIAEQLKKKSIAEYLLYMWQVEDTIRAYGLDVERMAVEYVPQFGLDAEKSEALKGWYESLVEMMREEGVTEKGHLQVNKNIIILLSDLHRQLLKSSKHPMYAAMYYKVLPFIVELRGKRRPSPQPSPVNGEGDHAGCAESIDESKGEIENCFEALYGVMLLRAQKKEVSVETATAIDHIAKFIGMLSEYYQKDKEGELLL